MFKEMSAAKKALESAEFAEKKWTVQPPPQQPTHRIKCSAIKGEMEAGNLDSGCMLYPIDSPTQPPLTASQVVMEFERIMRVAQKLKEAADEESRRLQVPLQTRGGGGGGTGQDAGHPAAQRGGQQKARQGGGRGALATEGQSSSVEQGLPGDGTGGKAPVSTGRNEGFITPRGDEPGDAMGGARLRQQGGMSAPPLPTQHPQQQYQQQHQQQFKPLSNPPSTRPGMYSGMPQHLPLPFFAPMMPNARPRMHPGTQPPLPQLGGGNPSLLQLHNQWQMSPMYGRDDPTLLDPFTNDGGANGGVGATMNMFNVSADDDMVNLDSVADRLQQDGLLNLLGMPNIGSGAGGGTLQNQLSPPQGGGGMRKFDHMARMPEARARSKADSLLKDTLERRAALHMCDKDIRCVKQKHTGKGKCKLAATSMEALLKGLELFGGQQTTDQNGSDKKRKRGPC